jgi:hypothetical protein
MKAILFLLLLATVPASAQTSPGRSGPLGVGTAAGASVSSVTTANVAVTVFAAGWMLTTNLVGEQFPRFSACDIVNPGTATEPLYVDLVTTATIGGATSIPLQSGQSYRISKPITGAVTAVAATAGHSFVTVCY